MAGAETYDFGECTWGMATLVAWVQGHWGNARDWAANAARAGFQLTNLPTVGAVVCYGAGLGYSQFGHVGLVRQVYSASSFLVHEMNFTAWDAWDDRVSNLVDVVAFILPPGVQAGAGAGVAGGQGEGSPDSVRLEWAGIADWLNQGADSEIAKLQLQYNLFWAV